MENKRDNPFVSPKLNALYRTGKLPNEILNLISKHYDDEFINKPGSNALGPSYWLNRAGWRSDFYAPTEKSVELPITKEKIFSLYPQDNHDYTQMRAAINKLPAQVQNLTRSDYLRINQNASKP